MPKLQALGYGILWRKVPESDAGSVGGALRVTAVESELTDITEPAPSAK